MFVDGFMKARLGDYIREYSVRNKINEDIPVYSVTNSQGFCKDYFGKEVASKDKSTYKIVPKGCFAYNPSRINVGSVDWQRNEERVIVSPLYNVFSVSSDLDNQYLYYFLKSDIALCLIKNIATGSVRDNLKLSMLYEFPINLPNIERQKEIVSTLDKLQSIITHLRIQLEKLDLLVKARFVEIFGDTEYNTKKFPVYKLSELCTVSSSKRIYQDEQSSTGVPFLRISNLVELIETGHLKNELFISDEKYIELVRSNLVPQKGDILVTSRGTLGKCYIVQDDDKFYFQDGMISWLYNLNKAITPLYLALLFNTRNIKTQIDNLQSGSTVAYLSITMLKKLNIVVPPLTLQNQFADFVKQVDQSKSILQQELDKVQMLFDSLMQEYFG